MRTLSNESKAYYISTREITEGTGNKNFGMYIGEQNNPACKQNKNILITSAKTTQWDDVIEIKTNERYKRRVIRDGVIIHKVGDVKYKKILRIVPFKDMSIREAWQTVFDYPTVSYGLNRFRREVLIIDSDVEYESLHTLKEKVSDFCRITGLPMVSYLLRNPSSGHAQIGWFLKEPFENTQKVFNNWGFNATIKRLSSVWSFVTHCDADLCFNGPACKNPYYEGFESIVFDSLPVDKLDFIKKLQSYSSMYCLPSPPYSYNTHETTSEVKSIPAKITKQRVKKTLENSIFNPENGRNNYLCHFLNVEILKYMNKHNGVEPDWNWTLSKANEIAKEAGKHFNNSSETTKEIETTARACKNFCRNHYNPDFCKKQDTSKAREKSILVKKCNKLINAVDVLSGKEKAGSRATLYRYRAMKENDWKELLEARKEFLSYFSSIKEHCSIMELSFDGYQLLEDRLIHLDFEAIPKEVL